MHRYDADEAPDPETWLRIDEGERIVLTEAHHRGRVLNFHPKGMNARLHAALHAVVENQVAANEPPATRRTVERLVATGLRRHAAIHMVADVLVKWIAGGEAYDSERYEAELDALDAASWLGDRMRKDLLRR